MYARLCDKLALDAAGAVGNSPEYSQPVAMNGGNAVQWEAVLFHLDRDGVFFRLQGTDDLEAWTDLGSNQAMTAIGHKLFTAVTQIAVAYVRLKYSMVTSGKAVLSAGINISTQ